MKYDEDDRESLHKLLDKIINDGEVNGMSRRIDTPIIGGDKTTMTTFRIFIKKEVEEF